ncbi:MAG: hypothetical protein A2017_14880 [Lentisphaerae bacterium GWF2_44_16]|nr:MAG: hypothetical protein A2017_14880 [Lentisphaerae bacterium GWF2_44_16]
MRDFTLQMYSEYLDALKKSYPVILRFDEFMSHVSDIPGRFCLIRHDIDRNPGNALRMALLEKELGVKATYYFRARPHVLKPDLIRQIAASGHEIGFHYESLSDAGGDYEKALELFKRDLSKLREIVDVRTIAMHGRPLSPFDNRDLWKSSGNKELLRSMGILGEVYLDIDYRKIAYVCDTGRNWLSDCSNLRDTVVSEIKADFHSSDELMEALRSAKFPKLVFQVHPERWSETILQWTWQLCFDTGINAVKFFYHKINR